MDIPHDKHQQVTEALFSIEAVSRLIESACERTGDSPSGGGVYGGACLIQREVKRIFELIGEQ